MAHLLKERLRTWLFANSDIQTQLLDFYIIHETTKPSQELTYRLNHFQTKECNCRKHKAQKCSTAGTNSTFSVVHGPEHPLVVGLLYEHPITTHTIRGVGSESLLHCHAVSYQNHTEASAGSEAMMLCTSTFSYCLKHCFSLRAPGVKWECSSHRFSSWTCSLSSPYLHLLSDIQRHIFFSPPLAKCLPAGSNVRDIHHREVCGEDSPPGSALLSTPRPHPWKNPHTAPTQTRAQTSIYIIPCTFNFIFCLIWGLKKQKQK